VVPRPVRPGGPPTPAPRTRAAGEPDAQPARDGAAAPAARENVAPDTPLPAVSADDVAGLRSGPADLASSPLGQRLSLLASDGDALRDVLSGVLGVDLPDIPALASLNLDEIERGELRSWVMLQDAVVHVLPYEGRALQLEVPPNVDGLKANLTVTLGRTPEDEPALTGVQLRFERPQPLRNRRLPTPPDSLPRIKNPSALDPSGDTFLGRRLDSLKDKLADITLRGFDVNVDGSLRLYGLAEIANGLVKQDFHELAKDQLPVLNLRLADLAAGNVIKGAPAPTTPATGAQGPRAPRGKRDPSLGDVSEWLGSLSTLANRGDWELELDTKKGRVRSWGTLSVQESGKHLHARAALKLDGTDDAGDVHVAAKLRARGSQGSARVALSEPETILDDLGGLGASWDEHGLVLDGLDIDELLPVKLSPWQAGDAPRVGSAAFADRIATLLDDVAPALKNQRVRYISDGHELLTERLRLIDAAGPGDALYMQTFILADDDTGSQIVDALIRARDRGADVRVLVDPIGSMDPAAGDVGGPPVAAQRLAAARVDVQLFNDPSTTLGSDLLALADALQDHPQLEALLHKHAAVAAAHLARGADALADLAALRKDPARLLAAAPGIAELAKLAADEDGPLPVNVRLAVLALTGSSDSEALTKRLVQELGRDHRKQIILLGPGKAEVLTGGNNVEDTYQLEKDSPLYDEDKHGDLHLWNDAHLLLEGADVTEQTARDFAQTWSRQYERAPALDLPAAGDIDPGDSSIRLVHHRPHATAPDGEGDNHFTNVLLATLEGLGPDDELTISNPYFLPLPALQDAMMAAAARGARLRILTNGPNENNDAVPIAEHARRFVFPRLLEQDGIEIFTTRGNADPVHKKTFVVRTAEGKSLYLVGSQNLDELSARVNREMFVLGGSALSGEDAIDPTAQAMLVEAERDLDAGNVTRVARRDLSQDPLGKTAATYLRSVLLPVL
jgi:phosphatidylserine/phosphatidylglycerophosphate/cardiolipin synthase-like enzyme